MIRRVVLAAATLAVAQAGAQQPVVPRAADPGAIQQRQIDEERRRRDDERERIRPTEPIKRDTLEQPAAQPSPDAVRFLVREIQFTRSEILSAAELEAIAADFRGRQLTLADLRLLAERVNALYKAKGVVTAQAVIPPQDVSDGVVHVRLVEGRVGGVNIEGNASTRSEYIANRLRVKPAELVDLGGLEEALVRFNRTNDVQLRAELKPGKEFGTTDLQIGVTEPPRHELRVTLDDFGSSPTGVWRTGIWYLNRSVLGFRDALSLSLTTADGQESRAYSYEFPINTWGGRLNLAHYHDQTEIRHGPLESLRITGESQAGVVSLRQPAYVSTVAQVNVLAGAKSRFSSNWIDTVFLQRTETSDRNLGAEVQVSDEKSFWLGSLTRYSGHATVIERRSYGIDRGALRYNRELGGGLSFHGNLYWQSTGERNLPSSEQFFLGGDGSVRGYAVGTFAGDQGYVMNLELHHPLANLIEDTRELAATGFFFVDQGSVKPFRPPNSALSSKERLTGTGWGIHATFDKRVYTRLTFGYGLTDLPSIPRHYEVHFQLVANVF
jgi:hemolysin activation/secretion protein